MLYLTQRIIDEAYIGVLFKKGQQIFLRKKELKEITLYVLMN